MKKEIKEKTLQYISDDFDGVILDLRNKLEHICPKAEIIPANSMGDLTAQADKSVDMVVCLKLHKFSDGEKTLDEIKRVLKDGGTFIACLKPYDTFRTMLKDKFDVNSYHTQGHYAYFEAQKKDSN
ncbi:MAG: methyltransferase domain-containing protein [Eubacterium sp.]|nr:methyltransferase domain-containing protein [Eubacterium sp.]